MGARLWETWVYNKKSPTKFVDMRVEYCVFHRSHSATYVILFAIAAEQEDAVE
jgi:hypothetical protein